MMNSLARWNPLKPLTSTQKKREGAGNGQLPQFLVAAYDGGNMKPSSFESTPEFANFRSVMQKLIKVPKAELDRMVREAADASPRKNNPNAPGRKAKRRRLKRNT
jgi:hypothetical protein